MGVDQVWKHDHSTDTEGGDILRPSEVHATHTESETLSTGQIFNTDNAHTIRVFKDGSETVAEDRSGEIDRGTDDDVVIQSAVDASGTEPGVIYFSKGIYEIDSPISWEYPKEIYMRGEVAGLGEGPHLHGDVINGTVFNVTDETITAFKINLSATGISDKHTNRFERIAFDGKGTAFDGSVVVSGAQCFNLKWQDQTIWKDCYFQNFELAIDGGGLEGVGNRYYNNVFTDNGKSIIPTHDSPKIRGNGFIQNGGNWAIKAEGDLWRAVITGNRFDGGNGANQAIYLPAGTNHRRVTISGNFIGDYNRGVWVEQGENITVAGNTLQKSSTVAIQIDGTDSQVIGNTIASSNKAVVVTESRNEVVGNGINDMTDIGVQSLAVNNLVVGNTLYNCGNDGIRVQNGDRGAVGFNAVVGSVGYGIAINKDSSDVVARNNVLIGNGQHGIKIESADARIGENIYNNNTNGKVDVSQGPARPKWNGIIYGGPMGGTNISNVTGADAGDLALTDGSSAAGADVIAVFDGSDWIYPTRGGAVTPS